MTTTTHAAPAQRRPLAASPSSSPPSSLAFLARFSLDAHDSATALGAFLAGLPQAPKRRAKTSSERGREFRARRQHREDELRRAVVALQNDIVALEMRRKTWETRCLHRATSSTGSLAQLAAEYHRLFTNGLVELSIDESVRVVGVKRAFQHDEIVHRTRLQEEFLRRVIDETGTVGNMVGPEASIVQWRRYTQCHDRFRLDVKAMEVATVASEDEDSPDSVAITAHCLVHAGLSESTVDAMFPHIRGDPELLNRVLGLNVTYPATRRFQFTRDGRIAVETVDVDFVIGLQNTGFSLVEIAWLMKGATIDSDCMIVEAEEPPPQVLDDGKTTRLLLSDVKDPVESSPPRGSVAFLLSDGAAP